MLSKIEYIEEPSLLFAGSQKAADPRDGLLLYGPYERWGTEFRFNAFTVSAAVIGIRESLEKYRSFVKRIKQPIISVKRNKRGDTVSNELQRPSFPGFEAVFNIHWPDEPDIFVEIKPIEIYSILKNEKIRRIRTSKLVELYLEKMLKASKGVDTRANIWFVIVPKDIYTRCRSKKGFGKEFSKETLEFFESQESGQGSFFSEEEMFGDEVSKYFDTSSDFHHLLKAKANQELLDPPIQIVVEPKLEFKDIETGQIYTDDMKAFLAWSLSTTLYYKLGKKPWKLAEIRDGVCYVGLVFKKFQGNKNDQMVCSAAQLFLNDGDGTIFRGNNGLWLSENPHEFHLDENEAFRLIDLALEDYFNNNQERYPKELFVHGRATFSDREWAGFQKAVEMHSSDIQLVGVVIQDKAPLKLFREVENAKANYGVMRGIAAIINSDEAYLFTRGFIPRLNSSSSLEVPNPLRVRIARGNPDIVKVLKDIMALTKLNYNACIYGDGKPVTLRFSDTIGSILTATENWKEERRQFIYYI